MPAPLSTGRRPQVITSGEVILGSGFPLALQSHAQSTRIVSIIIIPLLHLFGSVTSLLDYLAFFRSKLILYITFSRVFPDTAGLSS